MSFVNQPPCVHCNHDQIFFTGFLAGCAFLLMSLHLTRELYAYFKSKESELRQNFAPEEKSSSESDEDSSEGVEEKAKEEPNEKLCTNDEITLEKNKEVSSDDKRSNPTQSIEHRKNFAANIFKLDETRDLPSCEEPSHLYRSNSKYMTMSELEEIGKTNRKK